MKNEGHNDDATRCIYRTYAQASGIIVAHFGQSPGKIVIMHIP